MPLIDKFGRVHDNLRISVTDRCNIRCLYCMPDGKVAWTAKEEILTFEETERFARIAANLGVTKLRLTGGEPLLRKHIPLLVERLAAIPAIQDLGLTTNAVLLAEMAPALWAAGLRRLNVHLDTLDRSRFERITRRDELHRVLNGIDTALACGFRIKLNTVAMKGINDADIVPLARFGRERNIEVRYIEFMPLDGQFIWNKDRVMTQDEMVSLLRQDVGELYAVPDQNPHAPATEFRFSDGICGVGFISSVSKPFCMNCNRIRLTADGKLRYCLFAIDETDVRGLLRGGGSDEEIASAIRNNIADKWIGHEINAGAKFIPPPRPMYSIGG